MAPLGMVTPHAEANGDPNGVSRREFIASAGLTAGGVVTGLSYFFSRDPVYRPERSEVTVGVIGVGSRGGALLRSLLKVPGARVTCIADINDEALDAARENIQEAYAGNPPPPSGSEASGSGAPASAGGKDAVGKSAAGKKGAAVPVFATKDYLELLKQDVKAVVIATPHFMHGPMAIDALEAGKHVYCEKAMAFTVGECVDIYRLAKAREKTQVFQVGHQRHYSKLYRKVREMVHQGTIGNVTAIRAQWNRNHDEVRPCSDPRLERLINWRLYSEYSGGLMTEFASHQIDVANMLLGPLPKEGEAPRIAYPHSVCGMGGLDYPRYKRQKGRDTSDNVHVIFNYLVPFRERRKSPGADRYEWVETGEMYNVRFTYMSIMTNDLMRPSELVLGDEGTIEVSLGGGDFWKEPKALANPVNQAEGTNPASTHQKAILKTGATIAAVTKGIRPPDEPITIARERQDWTQFVGKVQGEHSPQETLLALDGWLEEIRKCERGDPYHVAASVEVGLASAVASIMGNIALRENRTVHWSEFGLPVA